MKTLPEGLEERLLRRVLEPWYLVTIELDQVYHLSTGPSITVDGVQYVNGYLSDEIFEVDARGARLQFFNETYRHTMAALNGEYRRSPVSIGIAPVPDVLYADQDGTLYADENGEVYIAQLGSPGKPIFSGFIDTISEITEWLTLEVERTPELSFPRRRIVPPFANFTRPDGTLVPVNSNFYRITTRSRSA